MSAIQAPKQLRSHSLTGKPKPAYIFKMLRLKGFEPFDAVGTAYHQERVVHDDGTWTDVSLRTDLRGVPITRQVVDGELQDVTWWHGPVVETECQRCSIAGGARMIVRTTRPSRHRQNGRVPEVTPDVLNGETGEIWHVACLKVRMQNLGRFGRDQKQTSSPVSK